MKNYKEFGKNLVNMSGEDILNTLNVLPYKSSNIKWWLMPQNTFNMCKPEEVDKFNILFNWIKENIDTIVAAETQADINELTKKHGRVLSYCIVDNSVSSAIILYVKFVRIIFKVGIRDIDGIYTKDNGRKLQGYQAFAEFRRKCKEYGVDLDDYAVSEEEGLLWKKKILNVLIEKDRDSDFGVTYENVHHLDFHNSYPAGLVNTHPEFKEIVEYFYNNRKVDPVNKAVLNYTIGYMQSGKINYRFAKLSHDAINDNVVRVRELAIRLVDSGRKVLLYNTDGIWYQGDIYHGENEGPQLGQWENDHTNCILRMKSAGSYEFIENGIYHPVVRGKTKLDEIKPRSEWEWGDIFGADASQIIKYEFSMKNGLQEMEAESYE